MLRVLATTLLLLCTAPLAAKDWQLDPAASHLRFAGTAQGEAFKGEFRRFKPTIALEPGKPESARIEVEVDVASADTQNKERDDALATPEFFAFDKFPKARFRTLSCKAGAGKDAYACDAELTIRDKTRKLAFPFTFSESDGKASLKSEIKLDRMAYDIGTGEWADTATLAHEVGVSVELTLK
jgi:polyisoprenoid-binding protein YceI